jgi:alkanesulfonate monooxygenase SsuD/methylene tetrahydromethanopterin reductase-like flavin-dependent oxidoreductase (luciferase family)
MSRRGRLADDHLSLLLRLLRGEPVQVEGRWIHVTPACATRSGPTILVAGGSRAAARRAARHGLGFLSQTDSPGLKEFYDSECRANGHEPGLMQFPVPNVPTTVFVADDVDKAWDELGPYLLHDALTAAAYRHGDDMVASISRADSVTALRDASGPYRIFTVDEAAEYISHGEPLPLLPLCGGIPPEVAWLYLERAVMAAERP